MAMNGTALGNKIADDVLAVNGIGLSVTEKANIRALWVTIATDITDHIDVNAEILPGTFTAGAQSVIGKGEIE